MNPELILIVPVALAVILTVYWGAFYIITRKEHLD